MAGKSASILVKILGDESGLKKSLAGAGNDLDQFAARMKDQGEKLQDAGKKMTVGVTLPLAALGAISVKNFMEAEKAQAQLEASLKSTGATAWTSADQIDDLARSMQKKYAVDGDLVKSGASLLLTFTAVQNKAGEGNDIFDRATQTALDLSRKLGMDLPAANMLLGKALNDPIKGMGTLRKAGVQLTEQQQEQVRAFVAAGDTMSAQKVILGELETQFKGSAEAYAQTAEGQLEAAKLAFEDVSEEIGAKLIPVLTGLGDKLVGLMEWWDGLSEGTQNFIVVAGGVAAAIGPLTSVVGTVQRGVGAMAELAGKLTTVTTTADGTTRSLTAAGKAAAVLGGALAAIAAIQIADQIRKSIAGEADRVTTAMEEMAIAASGSTEDVLAAFQELAGAQPDNFFSEIPQVFGKNLVIMEGLTDETIEDIEAAFESMSLGEQEAVLAALNDYGSGLERGSQAAKDNAGLIDNLTTRYERNTAATEAAGDAATGAAPDVAALGDAAEETGAQLEGASPGFDTFMAAVSGVKAMADELTSSLGELFGSRLDLEGATAGWEAAVDSLTEALKANGTTLDITTDKGRANRQTLIDATQSSLDLMNAEIAAGQSAEDAAAKHRMRVDALILEAVQGGMTEQQVRDLIGAYGDVPPQVITKAQFDSIRAMLDAGNLTAAAKIYGAMTPEARAEFDKSAASAQVTALQAELDRLNGRTTTSTHIVKIREQLERGIGTGVYSIATQETALNRDINGNGVIGRAGGGSVRRGQPYLVGEREPELFVPDQNGTILNQRQMSANGAAGVTVNVTFNGPVARDAERWIVEQVETAVARGVQMPRLKRAMA
jgi:hypothetical protein